jgi:hypothetical protein
VKYFLLLAAGYQTDQVVIEDGSDREYLVKELGAPVAFLERARPGDFYELERCHHPRAAAGRRTPPMRGWGPRTLICLGRCWDTNDNGEGERG